MDYTPNPRRRSDAELAELRNDARRRRELARSHQRAGDPGQAERDFQAAEELEAAIRCELEQRRH